MHFNSLFVRAGGQWSDRKAEGRTCGQAGSGSEILFAAFSFFLFVLTDRQREKCAGQLPARRNNFKSGDSLVIVGALLRRLSVCSTHCSPVKQDDGLTIPFKQTCKRHFLRADGRRNKVTHFVLTSFLPGAHSTYLSRPTFLLSFFLPVTKGVAGAYHALFLSFFLSDRQTDSWRQTYRQADVA